jgi:hypothetical protein
VLQSKDKVPFTIGNVKVEKMPDQGERNSGVDLPIQDKHTVLNATLNLN